MENLGVDLIKKAIKTIVDTGREIYEAKKNDGVITKIELFGLGDNIIAIGSQAIKINKIIEQVRDTDSNEARELYEYTISLGIASGDVQKILNHSFAYVQIQFDAYNDHLKPIIEIIKEKKEG